MDELRNCMRHMDLKGSLVRPTANPMLQFIRYVFVGGIATAIDWSTLYVLEHCRVHYLISAAAAYLAGLTVNYILSKRVVFNAQVSKCGRVAEFSLYALIGLIGLGMTLGLMYVLTDVCGLYYMISKVIATLVVLMWNYLARRLLYNRV